jgi:DNA polymerase III epsilon subunit family exonuclease
MLDYNILKKQLYTPLADLEFVAFDFETTGLYANLDRIIEIGAIKFNLQNIGPRFTTLINPEMSIPPESTKINGITDEMVRGKPTIQDVLPHFMNFIGSSVLVAHNAPFDTGFFINSLRSCALETLHNHIIDTIELAKQVITQARKYSLSYLCQILNIPLPAFHRAENDALACRELFLYCVRLISLEGSIILKDLYK